MSPIGTFGKGLARFVMAAALLCSSLVKGAAEERQYPCFPQHGAVSEWGDLHPLRWPDGSSGFEASGVLKVDGKADGDKDTFWAEVGRVVPYALDAVYQVFKDHEALKGSDISRYEVKEETREGSDGVHFVEFVVKPFPLISIRWTEQWIYTRKGGQAALRYQKVEGTSHLPHLCGQWSLRAATTQQTQIHLYEQIRASRRTQEETLKSVVDTFGLIERALKRRGQDKPPLPN